MNEIKKKITDKRYNDYFFLPSVQLYLILIDLKKLNTGLKGFLHTTEARRTKGLTRANFIHAK